MAAWRDIPSVEDWGIINKFCKLTDNSLLAALKELNNAIIEYHDVKKTAAELIPLRIQLLKKVSLKAKDFLDLSGFTKKEKKELGGSLIPWISHIFKQSEKKAAYLEGVSQFHTKFPSTVAITNHLKKRQLKRVHTDKVLSLDFGCYLEKMDPAHRDFEFSSNDLAKQLNKSGSLSNTLFFAYVDQSPNNSFLLWLEDKHVTTLTPKISSDWSAVYKTKLQKVKYGLPERKTVKIKNGVLLTEDGDLTTSKLKPCYKLGSPWGSTAFVWNLDNDFYTHAHKAGQFHHSSLTKGKKVKSAGMWLVEDGFVKRINNSSGHYKPNSLNFYILIRHLIAEKVVTEDTQIADMLRKESAADKGSPFSGVRSRYYPLDEYLEWAESLPEVKEYLREQKRNKSQKNSNISEATFIKKVSPSNSPLVIHELKLKGG